MGNLEIAKYLVTEYECDPNCASCDYDIFFTPLLMATIGGQFEVVRWLVSEQKCKPVFTYLEDQCEHNFPLYIIACQNGDLRVMKYLLSETNSYNLETHDLLFVACIAGHLNIVKYLIDECKRNPHYMDGDGISLLHVSSGGIHYFEKRKHHMSTSSVTGMQAILQILLAIINLPVKLFSNMLPKIYLHFPSLTMNGFL